MRPDFWDVVDHCVHSRVGVKFSTNGSRITPAVAHRLAGTDYVDVQISIDGADEATNDAVRGDGTFAIATTAMQRLADAGFADFKVSVVVTRENSDQLDAFVGLTSSYGAQLRPDRHPEAAQLAPLAEIVEIRVVEEELGADVIRAGVDLLLEVIELLDPVRSPGVSLREAGEQSSFPPTLRM